MVFYFSLSDSNSPQISRNLLGSILPAIIIIIIIFIVIIYTLEFFTSLLADCLSLEFKWQQVSSSLQDSS